MFVQRTKTTINLILDSIIKSKNASIRRKLLFMFHIVSHISHCDPVAFGYISKISNLFLENFSCCGGCKVFDIGKVIYDFMVADD
eukprot:Awhi_evm1s9130